MNTNSRGFNETQLSRQIHAEPICYQFYISINPKNIRKYSSFLMFSGGAQM